MNATPDNTAVITNSCYKPTMIPDTAGIIHESARRFNIPITVFEDKYPETFSFSELKVDRLQIHIDALPAQVRYILYVDSRDVIFLKSLEHICAEFNSFNHPLLFSAEDKCAPHRDPAWAARFPKQPNGFNFHNGGVYMAERYMLMTAFDQLKLAREWVSAGSIESSEPFLANNDQHLWQTAYLEGLIDTKLDFKQELFCSFHMCEWSDFNWMEGKNELVLKTGARPAIVHFAGERGPTIHMFWHLLKTGQLKSL